MGDREDSRGLDRRNTTGSTCRWSPFRSGGSWLRAQGSFRGKTGLSLLRIWFSREFLHDGESAADLTWAEALFPIKQVLRRDDEPRLNVRVDGLSENVLDIESAKNVNVYTDYPLFGFVPTPRLFLTHALF